MKRNRKPKWTNEHSADAMKAGRHCDYPKNCDWSELDGGCKNLLCRNLSKDAAKFAASVFSKKKCEHHK